MDGFMDGYMDTIQFLQGVLHCVQAHQAHTVLKASGVEDNAWFQVFHAVYGGIAADSCSGKYLRTMSICNGHHKDVLGILAGPIIVVL